MAKTDLRSFDPIKVGQLDADMWQAYYNHQFLKLFKQLILLIKYQLRLNWFLTVRLAYYSAWAAADYRVNKKKGTNNSRILKNLTNFYKLISNNSVEPFDYEKAAQLELAWWEVHRKSYQNNPALEKALAEDAAAIYNTEPAELTEYAHYRAVAMILPRHEGDNPLNETDWLKVAELTIRSWQSLYTAVQK